MRSPFELSPLGVAQNVRALAGRPLRHRRYRALGRTYHAPPDAWWAGDDRWFPGDTPPRHGNRLTPLVDGQDAMRAMYEAIESARESILLASWFLTPRMRMIRPDDDVYEPRDGKGGPDAFLALMARKAGEIDARILLWPGSLVGKFARRRVEGTRQALLQAAPKLQVRLDTHERFSHCQHQKALVVDNRVAFVGGLDVTAFDADRWDVREHTFREGRNWHDAHWRLEGPCVADVATNMAQRWNASVETGDKNKGKGFADPIRLPPPPPPLDDGIDAQVLRTIPKGVYSFASRGIFGIAYAYRHAIVRAERFIYLENQYLWSPEITDALCDAIRRGHDTGLRVVLVLPAHPNVGKGDTDRHVEQLVQADAGRGAFHAYTLYTSRHEGRGDAGGRYGQYKYRPVYVHAKVGIVDDTWATVGSANLNGRGMVTDSELNISAADGASARALRLRLWAEHLHCPEDELRDADPVAVLEGRWLETARAQRDIVARRSGILTAALYPYPLGRVDADFGPGEIESALLDR